MSGLSTIQVIIPALNEAGALPGVLARLRELGLERIRVVDNGSRDGTADAARAAGVEVVQEPMRGYGRACWRGLQDLPEEVEWILFCDADGSDALEDLPRLLAERGDADFILGNRAATEAGRSVMSPPQRWGNRLATWLIRLGWGFRFHDLGPMRLIRRAALERVGMEDRGFGWTVEMQIRAVELGLRIREIPVAYHRRKAGASKISGTVRGVVSAGTIILGTWLKFWMRKGAVQGRVRLVSSTLLVLGAVAVMPVGDFARLGVHPLFWMGCGLMAAGYALSWLLRHPGWGWFLGVAVLARLILLPMFPGDDVWRYLWEGRIQWAGFNPYVHAPAAEVLAGLRTPWWELVQHKEITAIYPPLAQAFLRLAALGPGWWLLKGLIVAADLAVAVLVARRFGTAAGVRYAWCPLVLVVFAGGAHFDAWMLLAMVAGWLLWESGRWRTALLAMGAACGIKYVAGPLLLWMLWRTLRERGPRAAWVGLGLAALPTLLAILWLPFPWRPLDWVPGDFAQYARSADFLPRLVGELWEESLRMNHLYVLPAAVAGLWVALRARTLAGAAENWFLALMVVSPLVHGWYFTWALPFAAAAGHWCWCLAGISGLVYFYLQQTSFEQRDWLLPWPLWLLMWAPLLLGAGAEHFARREDRR